MAIKMLSQYCFFFLIVVEMFCLSNKEPKKQLLQTRTGKDSFSNNLSILSRRVDWVLLHLIGQPKGLVMIGLCDISYKPNKQRKQQQKNSITSSPATPLQSSAEVMTTGSVDCRFLCYVSSKHELQTKPESLMEG